MKKISSTIIAIFLGAQALFAQDKVVELKQLKQDVIMTVKDSVIILKTDQQETVFKIKKDKNKREYEFAQPAVDSNKFYNILSIDKLEINDKYNTAVPGVSAAQQLITMVAAEPGGVKLVRLEEGGVPADGQSAQELGGQVVEKPMTSTSDSWTSLLIPGLVGLIGGVVTTLLFRKKTGKAVKEDAIDITSSEQDAPIDTSSTEKLTAQVKKYRDDNRKLKAELKNFSKDFESKVAEYKQHDAFLNTYFNNVFNEFVKPFNEAIERNDQTQAFQLLFNMSSQLSSLTKHELRVKQSYDTHNIAYVMRENIQNQNGIEVVTSATSKDSIPKNVKTLIDMMNKVGVASLGQSIFYGYRIQKDK